MLNRHQPQFGARDRSRSFAHQQSSYDVRNAMHGSVILRLASTRTSVALLFLGAAAWILTVIQARAMGSMAPMTPISFPAFVAMWSTMMAAMMLPSLVPLASRYARAVKAPESLGVASLVVGYLAVWTAVGSAGYMLSLLLATTLQHHPGRARGISIACYACCGIYQLTPLKDRCLSQCRAPLALLLTYVGWRGWYRHLRVGVHHAATCVGCCWALMLVLFVAGLMNLGAMVLLTLVIAVEKIGTRGPSFSRCVGIVSLLLAAVAIWKPELAPGILSGVAPMTHP